MIRRATTNDIPRLCELMGLLGAKVPPKPKVESKFNYILNSPDYYVVVYEEWVDADEVYRDSVCKIVGTSTIYLEYRFSPNKPLIAHLENVVVDEQHRNMGYGRELVVNCIEFAKRAGAYKIILNCNEKNIGYYEKLGFKRHEVGMRMDL